MNERLETRIASELTEAMRRGDEDRKRTLRSLRAAIKTAEMEAVRLGQLQRGQSLDEATVLGVLQKQAKQRRESIALYREGGRDDLVAVEETELAIIESYLPKQMSEEEIEAAAREQIADVGAEGPSDMGKVMGPLMQSLEGRADGKLVSAVVRRLLAS